MLRHFHAHIKVSDSMRAYSLVPDRRGVGIVGGLEKSAELNYRGGGGWKVSKNAIEKAMVSSQKCLSK